jgi:nitrate/nitrite transporter NarK
MLPSRFQAEVDSICEAGVESYLADKHRTYRLNRLGEGAFGAFVGIVGILGMTQIKDSGIKLSYAIVPISAAIIVSSLGAIFYANKNDEAHIEEFNDVCDNK